MPTQIINFTEGSFIQLGAKNSLELFTSFPKLDTALQKTIFGNL